MTFLKAKKNSFFSNYAVIDWYDGVISGIGKSAINNNHYFFDVRAVNLETKEKIFLLILIKSEIFQQISFFLNNNDIEKVEAITKELFLNKRQDLLFLKTKDIDSNEYDFVTSNKLKLKYTKGFDEIVNQSKKITTAFFKLFNDKDSASN